MIYSLLRNKKNKGRTPCPSFIFFYLNYMSLRIARVMFSRSLTSILIVVSVLFIIICIGLKPSNNFHSSSNGIASVLSTSPSKSALRPLRMADGIAKVTSSASIFTLRIFISRMLPNVIVIILHLVRNTKHVT